MINVCVCSLQDPRFNAEVDLITGYKTQTILCLPIKNHKEEVPRGHAHSCTSLYTHVKMSLPTKVMFALKT